MSSINTPVPSMTTRGWLYNPAEKIDQVMSYFFEADPSSTYLYNGYVVNVQTLLQQYGNDIPSITNEIRTGLEQMLRAYFDSAQVQVTNNDDPTVNTSNAITLYIAATVTQAGKSYSLDALVQQVNSKFIRVINYTNTGVLDPLVPDTGLGTGSQ